jgi:hypothetical protein
MGSTSTKRKNERKNEKPIETKLQERTAKTNRLRNQISKIGFEKPDLNLQDPPGHAESNE